MPRYRIAYDQDPEQEQISGPEALERIQAVLDIVTPGDRGRVVQMLGQFLQNESASTPAEPEVARDTDIRTRQETNCANYDPNPARPWPIVT